MISGFNRRRISKPTVETCPLRLSISELSRRGVLQRGAEGELRKTDAAGRVATVFFKTGHDILELRFSVEGPSLNGSLETIETITLVWTPCHYGGQRPWFRCPGIIRPCAWRVGILYATGAHFLCRHCSGLVYQSQHEDAEGRAALRAYRLRARLGDHGDLLDPLPKRPPGMHHRTYQRLCEELETAVVDAAPGYRNGFGEVPSRSV